MKDSLGDRMKGYYEGRTKQFLQRRTYTIIRIDGKAFHTYTRGLEKPFDSDLMDAMDETMKFLCENIQGAKIGYVQSDEISILLTDFDKLTTDAWFDNNVQKVVSVSSSMATAIFNRIRDDQGFDKMALFDSRVFQVPTNIEVMNYFLWRQQDCVRNSISSVAQANFSHKELNRLSTNQMQDKLMTELGINWNNFLIREKRGAMCFKYEDKGWIIAPAFDLYSEEDKKRFIEIVPKNEVWV